MNSVELPENYKNLWDLPNLLLQKTPADEFTATAKVKLKPRFEGERFGLLVMGIDYSALVLTNIGGKLFASQLSAKDADKGSAEIETPPTGPFAVSEFYLQIEIKKGAIGQFRLSPDGMKFNDAGLPFRLREGRWIGAKIGFFFTRPGKFNDAGTADVDWFRIDK